MQFQTEFQYDPAQDRRAARTGQEWVEFIVCAFVCLEETGTTAPARCLDAMVPISSSCTDVRPLVLRWRRIDPRTRQVIYSPRAIPRFIRIAMQSYEFVRLPLWLRLLSIRWRRLCLCVFTHNTQRCRSALSGLFSPTHHSLFR
jgi:hypothetical protein